jgi:hypothetical protein
VETNHAGWREIFAVANVAQDVRVTWHVDPGGHAQLEGRDPWTAAEWQTLWEGKGKPENGELVFRVERPTLLRLRVRGPRFPRSGIARLVTRYRRHTVAVLRGQPGTTRRPVMLAEGYDPLNTTDFNDPLRQLDPTFGRLIQAARARYGLDPWLLDWGDGGASIEQQAEDFAHLAREVRAWNGGRSGTVAVGISMGAVTLRCALARNGDGLGVRKYISINGPHQGAWINPDLRRFLLRRTGKAKDLPEGSPAALVRRGLDSPAARELLIGTPRHAAFYGALRGMGERGYAPRIPRVAFSNGTLTREGNELAELANGGESTLHQISLRPLWLPVWFSLHRTRMDFRYGAFPGELLPLVLAQPVHTHKRFLGIFRVDLRAQWEKIPTFIPTHSALDFPEDLVGGPERFSYSRWRESAFSKMYVARGRNLSHDDTTADWIDPRTGRGAPSGENAVLYEIRTAFQ